MERFIQKEKPEELVQPAEVAEEDGELAEAALQAGLGAGVATLLASSFKWCIETIPTLKFAKCNE